MSFLGKTIGKIVSNQLSSTKNRTESNDSTSNTDMSTNTPTPTTTTTTTSTTSNQTSFVSQLTNSFQRNHSITYSTQYQQDAQLTLTHLRKLFYEYLHPKMNLELNQTEKDEKLYSILPLFIKVKNTIFYLYFLYSYNLILLRHSVMFHSLIYTIVSMMLVNFVSLVLVYL